MNRQNRYSTIFTIVFGLLLLGPIVVHADSHMENEYRDFKNMKPSGTLTFEVKSLKLLVGGSWGKGTLDYQGKSYPLKVVAITAGGVGYRSIKGTGEVYNLNNLNDFEGIYQGGVAGATIAKKGGGITTLENTKRVVLQAKVTDSSGAQLSISLSGVEIEFAN